MHTFLILPDAEIAARHDPTWLYSTMAQTAGADRLSAGTEVATTAEKKADRSCRRWPTWATAFKWLQPGRGLVPLTYPA
jgi:hypothetical protein